MADYIMNLMIFIITAVLVVLIPFKDTKEKTFGAPQMSRMRKSFRFFTVQSNAFCAVTAFLMCLFPQAQWAWILKYVGTAAVMVTFLTVMFFLGPAAGYKAMLSGDSFFMHLLTPLMAFVSFSFLEKRGMSFKLMLLGLVPVILYGILYMVKIFAKDETRRWEDFYGFNRGGKWYIALPAMMVGSFLICLGLWALQNI